MTACRVEGETVKEQNMHKTNTPPVNGSVKTSTIVSALITACLIMLTLLPASMAQAATSIPVQDLKTTVLL